MNTTDTHTDASHVCCPNLDGPARGKIAGGKLVSHGKKRERSTCTACGRTCCARQGTMVVGVRTPEERIVMVVSMRASGCPVHAIVHALGWDERTVARRPGASGGAWPPGP